MDVDEFESLIAWAKRRNRVLPIVSGASLGGSGFDWLGQRSLQTQLVEALRGHDKIPQQVHASLTWSPVVSVVYEE